MQHSKYHDLARLGSTKVENKVWRDDQNSDALGELAARRANAGSIDELCNAALDLSSLAIGDAITGNLPQPCDDRSHITSKLHREMDDCHLLAKLCPKPSHLGIELVQRDRLASGHALQCLFEERFGPVEVVEIDPVGFGIFGHALGNDPLRSGVHAREASRRNLGLEPFNLRSCKSDRHGASLLDGGATLNPSEDVNAAPMMLDDTGAIIRQVDEYVDNLDELTNA